MVVPAVLITCLLMLFLLMFVYQQVNGAYHALTTAERTASVWENSRKDWVTGQAAIDEHDGLYWRITNDHALDLFDFAGFIPPAHVQLPAAGTEVSKTPHGKLTKGGSYLPKFYTGAMEYNNKGLLRSVNASVRQPFSFPSFAPSGAKSETTGDAVSYIVDPVELIRLTDLTRTFIQDVKDRITPKAAKGLLKDPVSVPKQQTEISSHRAAVSYLQLLAGGQGTKLLVPDGSMREIDVLDAGKVAHQAYYTYTESQLRKEQLPKDAALIQEGSQVKGVVWHFFATGKQKNKKPSASLRRELERSGIVVIIHE